MPHKLLILLKSGLQQVTFSDTKVVLGLLEHLQSLVQQCPLLNKSNKNTLSGVSISVQLTHFIGFF